MALIKCPNCQNTVSDKALQCPKCGFPILSYLSTQNSAHQETASPYKNQSKRSKILKASFLIICIILASYLGIIAIEKHNERIELENQLRIERETYLPTAEAVDKICETFTVSIDLVTDIYALNDNNTYFIKANKIGYVISHELPRYTAGEREQIHQLLGDSTLLPIRKNGTDILMKYDVTDATGSSLSYFTRSIVQEGLDAVFETECLMAEEVDIELVKKYYKELNS